MSLPLICPACARSFPPGTDACPDDGTPLRAVEATAISDPIIGQQLGDYIVEGRLGVGGMGIVYRAKHPDIGKTVAIKVLKPEIANDPDQMQRLLAEARSVNAIRDPGIIDIFGFGRVKDGRQYMVMEFLEGKALDEVIAEHQGLPLSWALTLFDEMLSALGAAHRAGVIHRDIKPSNVFLVQKSDGSHYVKLVDFGLAKKSVHPAGLTPQTYVDRVVGTPEFMAPEQARGEAVSPRTDLYAMGVVLFEMVTGTVPFTAPTMVQLVVKHLEEAPPAPSSMRDGIPPEVDELVLWMMEKEPENRPASTEAIRERLKTITAKVAAGARGRLGPASSSGNPKLASAPTRISSTTTMVVKKRGKVVIAGAAAGVIALAAIGYLAFGHSSAQATDVPKPLAHDAVAAKIVPADTRPTQPTTPTPTPTSTPAPTPTPPPAPTQDAKVDTPTVAHAAPPAPPPKPAAVVPAKATAPKVGRAVPTKEQLQKRAREIDRKLRSAASPNRALITILESTSEKIDRAKSEDDRKQLDATLTEIAHEAH